MSKATLGDNVVIAGVTVECVGTLGVEILADVCSEDLAVVAECVSAPGWANLD